MSGILDEYLVKLGFTEDTAGYARFAATLRGTTSLVDNEVFRMGKRFIEFQTGAVGAFAAIGAAAIGIADKTAMADQEYRLLALHMYTSLPVARELKIALDALGQPLENIMWDPELSQRFNQLVKDQRTLTEELGPDFEKQMFKIRDLRFEFTRFGVELEYLTMNVVQDLARAFGTNIDDVLDRLRSFNQWFIGNMPSIAQWIADNLKPILIDVKDVLSVTWDLVKQTAAAFTNLIGILSGDHSLEGTSTSFDKISKAIQISLGWLKEFVVDVTHAEQILIHLINAAAAVKNLDFGGAKKELQAASTVLPADQMRRLIVQSLIPIPGMGALADYGSTGAQEKIATESNLSAKDYIAKVAKQLGVPVDLAMAVAQVESNYRQFGPNGQVLQSTAPGSHAMGMFQLQPGTAKMLGVDPRSESQNIFGGVSYLKQLLARSHGDTRAALEHYYGSKDAAANTAYANKVMHVQSGLSIGSLNVTVTGGGNHEAIKWSVVEALREAEQKRTQRNLAEFNQPSWGYDGGGSY